MSAIRMAFDAAQYVWHALVRRARRAIARCLPKTAACHRAIPLFAAVRSQRLSRDRARFVVWTAQARLCGAARPRSSVAADIVRRKMNFSGARAGGNYHVLGTAGERAGASIFSALDSRMHATVAASPACAERTVSPGCASGDCGARGHQSNKHDLCGTIPQARVDDVIPKSDYPPDAGEHESPRDRQTGGRRERIAGAGIGECDGSSPRQAGMLSRQSALAKARGESRETERCC